jgi:hypothetical protein
MIKAIRFAFLFLLLSLPAYAQTASLLPLGRTQYFDNNGFAKNQFTGSLPAISSGSFGGAVGSNIPSGRAANFYQNIGLGADNDTQGLVGNDYAASINLLSNTDEYKYKLNINKSRVNIFKN